jgi:hypothetical protein
MSGRSARELGVGIAGMAYLVLVFMRNLYSPLIAIALAGLAAYELMAAHRTR